MGLDARENNNLRRTFAPVSMWQERKAMMHVQWRNCDVALPHDMLFCFCY